MLDEGICGGCKEEHDLSDDQVSASGATWGGGRVHCPLPIVPDGMLHQSCPSTAGPFPDWCPFALEHLVAARA